MHRKVLGIVLLGASAAAIAAGSFAPVRTQPAAPPPAPAIAAAASAAVQAPPPVSAEIASTIARWNSLRQSDNLPFNAYASFLAGNRGWPGEAAMRRAAERQIDTGTVPPHDVVRYFAIHPPLTAGGRAKYASALMATGDAERARAEAREAWRMGVLPQADSDRLLSQFGGTLTQVDHDLRIDRLLYAGATTEARRLLPLTSPGERPFHEARLALQTNAPDARQRYEALGAAATAHPGVVLDRANYMRNTGSIAAARQFMAERRTLASRPGDPKKYMEGQLALARGAANDRQWQTVYQIASQVDGLYAPGTDISAQPFGERDDYTSITWLAGTAALQHLNRPGEAVGMFERYARAAQSPQTRTKGLYWAGRAAEAGGDRARADAFYREAAGHYDQFYGQLSAERIRQPLPAPDRDGPTPPSAAERQAFYAKPLVQATRHVGRTGSWRDGSEFVRALAVHVETDAERRLAAELATELGRPDLGVHVARQARSSGSFDYKRWGFPEVRVPATQRQHWAMVHAITRQESLFDREAVSHAGARGLMQLMPGTARETAGRLGLPYEQARLTRDTDYNVMLGSAYFAGLLQRWGGNYPLAVASYNAGPGNVNRWVRENGDPRMPHVDVIDWIEAIPFFETRNYVQRVLENAVVYDLLHPDRAGSRGNDRLSFYLGKSRPG